MYWLMNVLEKWDIIANRGKSMTQSECVAMENEILLYTDETGKMNVNVRFAEEDVWVTQVQLAEIYATTRQNIGQHIENIYKDNELPREATIKKFFIVQTEGNRQVKREIDHYNLDVIIAIGYRVQSETATRFRRWATQRLISSKRTCKS